MKSKVFGHFFVVTNQRPFCGASVSLFLVFHKVRPYLVILNQESQNCCKALFTILYTCKAHFTLCFTLYTVLYTCKALTYLISTENCHKDLGF